ncbi:30S ribosomal protein S16 [Buchnera aphidicola (Thelaxes californica)]|uniref:Small ribosomal subunit protein bS16 n=1 Tax=Buchnera aphidicola (Thelaxes californica) TaxID=1315998 RepID=A0A4D6YCM4_9GAMM|nr:30S ribosomal protein S16 [Buchnera aphidicola]QCI26832.1 30S ribosomal protein S16 [Buchnera aphidicola (Thelaxes californica)]
MIKIRLARHGVKKKPFYKIIIADSKSPRDGKFIEKIGFFNPFSKNEKEKIHINLKRLEYWIQKGAQLSDRTKYLIKKTKKNNIII